MTCHFHRRAACGFDVSQNPEKVRPWTSSAPLRRSEFGSAPGIIRLLQRLGDSAGPSCLGQAALFSILLGDPWNRHRASNRPPNPDSGGIRRAHRATSDALAASEKVVRATSSGCNWPWPAAPVSELLRRSNPPRHEGPQPFTNRTPRPGRLRHPVLLRLPAALFVRFQSATRCRSVPQTVPLPGPSSTRLSAFDRQAALLVRVQPAVRTRTNPRTAGPLRTEVDATLPLDHPVALPVRDQPAAGSRFNHRTARPLDPK
jgi:hypothetical protein